MLLVFSFHYTIEQDSINEVPVIFHSFIHSSHFYSAPSSPLLLRGDPDHSTDTEFHAEAHRQLQAKDLPKVPTWRLEGSQTHDPPVESHRLNQGATTSHIFIKQLIVWDLGL